MVTASLLGDNQGLIAAQTIIVGFKSVQADKIKHYIKKERAKRNIYVNAITINYSL